LAKTPFLGGSVNENPATAVFFGIWGKTSVNRHFSLPEKRQPPFPLTARTAGGSDCPGAAKAPGLSPAFSFLPYFCCV